MTQTRWNIDRSWEVFVAGAEPSMCSTAELARFQRLGMLGAAGLGKTVEAEVLAGHERAAGRDVRWCRLAEHAGTADELARVLDELLSASGANTSIFLDAMDEAMIPLRRAWLTVERWLNNVSDADGPRIRVTCRPAVWPPALTTAITRPEELSTGIAHLQSLSDQDIVTAAEQFGVAGVAFLHAVRSRRADLLAQHPMTLRMLLHVHRAGEGIPSSVSELFRLGVRELAADAEDRVQLDTNVKLPVEQILMIGETVACCLVLTGKQRVSFRAQASADEIPWSALAAASEGIVVLDQESLRALANSGLCTSRSEGTFEFAHRQFGEYLAGRCLSRMLPHQAISLLASSTGSDAGVAGPLRETASFAAMHSSAVADWLGSSDPEVIGLSDVADASLRRRALLSVLDQFRQSLLTDSQIGRGELELWGLRYEGVADDLRPMLAERGTHAEDLLDCVIDIVNNWELRSMAEDMATLMLDPTAPYQARKAAGYALLKIGTPEARARVLPLVSGSTDDEHDELKALAIECNWPARVTTPTLLNALSPRPESSYHGAFDMLLWHLDVEGFDASGHSVQGLAWAEQHFSALGDSDPGHRIAMRIVHTALTQLHDQDVAEALVSLLLKSAAAHRASPLGPLVVAGFRHKNLPPALPGALENKPAFRRPLIEAVAQRASDPQAVGWLAHHTPGMCNPADFSWLLERATDTTLPLKRRTCYVEIARWIPWTRDRACVRAWRRVCNQVPVSPTLDGWVAKTPFEWVRLRYHRIKYRVETWHDRWRHRPKRIQPSPRRRVRQALKWSETDARHFHGLCRQLCLKDGEYYVMSFRFLTASPGWTAASAKTRTRILSAARRFLAEDTETPRAAYDEPLSSLLNGGVEAMWLLMECDPPWLESQDGAWWGRWAWYTLRELHINMVDEPRERKHEFVKLLHRRAAPAVRRELVRLIANEAERSGSLLEDLLNLFQPLPDAELDASLLACLSTGTVPADRIGGVARFLLTRGTPGTEATVVGLLPPGPGAASADRQLPLAIALLQCSPAAAWSTIAALVRNNAEHGRRILAGFAHHYRRPMRRDEDAARLGLAPAQAAELFELLLEIYPPSEDPEHAGAYFMGEDDSARELRDRLITSLGDRDDVESVEALRDLEQRHGAILPWLRRPRARAQRNLRLSQWSPMDAATVVEFLGASQKRLLRSAEDVTEGVMTAIAAFDSALHREGAAGVEDLWNTPRQATPTPKAEEHVSNKLCGAIRTYFQDFAVSANREVEIRRRAVPADMGGAPGSELDVLVHVPSRGAASNTPVVIPIEVKLSFNTEAPTALRDQLAERYMNRLATNDGVYVVGWMMLPNAADLHTSHRPRWPSKAEALADLERQAATLLAETGQRVRVVVVDMTLR